MAVFRVVASWFKKSSRKPKRCYKLFWEKERVQSLFQLHKATGRIIRRIPQSMKWIARPTDIRGLSVLRGSGETETRVKSELGKMRQRH